MITTVLWDVDGTLLDFGAAERAAIKTLFEEFGLGECTDEMIARYSEINIGFWQKLERNEITKVEVLVRRFEQFFGEYGVDTSIAPKFNERYQLTLGDTIVYRDDSLNIIKSLKRRGKAVRCLQRHCRRADKEARKVEARRAYGRRVPLGGTGR